MAYIVTLKATKYITLNINDAPDEESAKEFARLQVRTQFPIVEVIDIEDAQILEEMINGNTETKTLSDMPDNIDNLGGKEDKTGVNPE